MPYWAKAPYGSCSDSTEFQLLSVDPKDAEYMPAIKAMGPKLVLSIGGWNFPSEYFSKMASSSDSRGKFISSIKQWQSQYGIEGADLDWEFPCSGPRSDAVKISCKTFRSVTDAGGNCPADTNNLLALVKDMRAGLGDDFLISIASQAGNAHADNQNMKAVSEYIDMWHIMSYDYSVSDVPGTSVTNPNAPLYMPEGGLQMSVNDSVTHYINAGVPKSKIMVGLPLYAHTWYAPGLTGSAWQKFGLDTQIQGECCGPFASTGGAKPGQGCQLCGSMMYSEILAGNPETYYDEQTQSTIAYFTKAGEDGGYTAAGTWLSYNDLKSSQAFVKYEKEMGLAGLFVYSTDMDTNSGGSYTYDLMNGIADAMAVPVSPTPAPVPTPAPCPGGSLTACITACPTTPLAAFTACISVCSSLCPQ